MTPPSTSSISTPTSARPNSSPTPGSTSSAGTAPRRHGPASRATSDSARTSSAPTASPRPPRSSPSTSCSKFLKVRRFALVSPYVGAVQQRIIETYGDAGYECVAERHFEERVNYAFAEIEDVRIAEAVRQVSTARPEAVVIMCTNLRSAHLVAALEAELGIPVLDSVAAFVWKAVRLCGIDTRAITGWGRLFALAGSLRTRNTTPTDASTADPTGRSRKTSGGPSG